MGEATDSFNWIFIRKRLFAETQDNGMMRCCCSCCCFYVTKLAALFDKYAVAALLLSFVWMPQEMSPGA